MITTTEYFRDFDAPDDHRANADVLLERVAALMETAFVDGIDFDINPKTHSHISGARYGGYRPQDCPIGATNSSHKTGQAVDVYDPFGRFAEWCYTNQDKLSALGLYMEHPSATPSWCHLTTRAPASKKIAFIP